MIFGEKMVKNVPKKSYLNFETSRFWRTTLLATLSHNLHNWITC